VHAITAEEVARFRAGAEERFDHRSGIDPALAESGAVPRVGFVVSKAVGNSVVRHRVVRRLRHVVRDRLGTVRPGCTLVVRALSPAASAASADLGSDIDAALRRLRLSRDDSDTGGAK
jgi:ribonuclease P protein component